MLSKLKLLLLQVPVDQHGFKAGHIIIQPSDESGLQHSAGLLTHCIELHRLLCLGQHEIALLTSVKAGDIWGYAR